MTVTGEPRFGYGKYERPLWSPRDRDAEVIRQVLRRAGFRDVDEQHLDGFAVEGANASEDGPEPFDVVHCGDPDPAMLAKYQAALTRAGLRGVLDSADANVFLVHRYSVLDVRKVPRPARSLLIAAVVCAVVAAVALIASWVASGPVELIGGIGSAILSAVAVALAGFWYLRRVDEDKSAT